MLDVPGALRVIARDGLLYEPPPTFEYRRQSDGELACLLAELLLPEPCWLVVCTGDVVVVRKRDLLPPEAAKRRGDKWQRSRR